MYLFRCMFNSSHYADILCFITLLLSIIANKMGKIKHSKFNILCNFAP